MAVAKQNMENGSRKVRSLALLALFFVAAQFFAAAHAGAYGDTDHLHNGHPCIVASIVKKASDMDVAAAPEFALDDHAEWIEAVPLPIAPESRTLRSGTIRAPPVHV